MNYNNFLKKKREPQQVSERQKLDEIKQMSNGPSIKSFRAEIAEDYMALNSGRLYFIRENGIIKTNIFAHNARNFLESFEDTEIYVKIEILYKKHFEL